MRIINMRREEEEETPPVLTWHISLSTLHVTRSWHTAITAQDAVPVEYKEFQHLFNQLEQPELLIYGLHNHTIPLEEGKNPVCKKIYLISEKELHTLWEYIDKQLKKETIKASKSPAGHRVLFISKKDGSL